jgi:hypothetical protein
MKSFWQRFFRTQETKKIKVKMLHSVAGNADARYDLAAHGFRKGQTVALHPELAKSWIASGRAEAFTEETAFLGAGAPDEELLRRMP